jgi:hypothetical protein
MDEIEPACSCLPERLLNIGKFPLENRPKSRHEIVWLPELRNTFAHPAVPCVQRRIRYRVVIAFENGYVVPVAGKQKSGAKAAYARAQNENFCHVLLPLILNIHDCSPNFALPFLHKATCADMCVWKMERFAGAYWVTAAVRVMAGTGEC